MTMKGEQKRTATTKQNTNSSSYFIVQEVTPQILSFKPFVIFKSGLIGFSFVQE